MGSSAHQRTVGELIFTYRTRARFSRDRLAELTGLSARGIEEIEKRRDRCPRAYTLKIIADKLELSDDERAALSLARSRMTPRLQAARGTPRPRRLGVPPLVGRDDQQRLIRELLVEDGPPVLAFIGETGIGKSRLLIEAADQGEAYGWLVLRGEAHRDEGQHPFTPIFQALERHIASLAPVQRQQALHDFAPMLGLFPELADLNAPPTRSWQATPMQERTRMFTAVGRYFAHLAESNGVLLILDDLQWAQPDALMLLKSLLRSPEVQSSFGLCVVAAVRSGGPASNASLRDAAHELEREGLIVRTTLGPLADQSAAQLVDYMLGALPSPAPTDRKRIIERLVKRSSGLPFFLTSLANEFRQSAPIDSDSTAPSARERIPTDITEMTHQRIAALPPAAGEVLALAAVFGREVPLATLTLISGLLEAEVVEVIEAACADQLLRESDDGVYAFRHDLVREAILADLKGARRTLLHHRIGEALESQPHGDTLDALAYHFSRTADDGKAIYYLERAGDHARVIHAHAAAESYYQQALRRLERRGVADVNTARLQEKLGDVLLSSARYRDALAPLESAAQAYERTGDLDGAGRVVAQIAWTHVKNGAPEEAMARLKSSLAPTSMTRLSVAVQAALWRAHAVTLFTLNLYSEQHESAHRACDCAREAGDNAALAQGLRLEALALGQLGRISESIALAQEAIRLAQIVRDLETYTAALNDAGAMYRARGELATSWNLSKLALKEVEPLRDPMATAFFSSAHGVDDFLRGDWRAARRRMLHAVSVAEGIGPSWVAAYPLADLGLLNLVEGRAELGIAQLEKALGFACDDHDLQAQRLVQAPLADYDVLRGDARGAIARLEPLIDHSSHSDKESVVLLPLLCRAYVANGQLDLATSALEECKRQATASGAQLVLLDALLAEATLQISRSNLAQATSLLDQAIKQAHDMGHPYAEAKALSLRGSALAQGGDIAGARASYGEALKRFGTLGEQLYASIASAQLRRLDGPNGSPKPSSFNRFV
ncbi:MAG TPA: AAA family ATPase [Ktedonobacterales bacterium]